MPQIVVRRARREDADALLSLVDALADYEKLDRPDQGARARLTHDGFEREPARFSTLLAVDQEDGDTGERLVGYAIFFETYSSFLAKPTLYIEDLFVLPDARKNGAGSALFSALAREAVERGCGRMEWVCLDWNELAIGFYEARGAEHLSDWRHYRLSEADLRRLTDANEMT